MEKKALLLVAALVVVGALGAVVWHQAQTIARPEKDLSSPQPASAPATTARAGPVDEMNIAVPAAEPPTEPAGSVTAELLAMVQERDRYKAGLERCVAELNAKAATAEALEMARTLGQGISRPAGRPDIISVLGPPWVYPRGDYLEVTGKLYNRGSASGIATVAITVFREGKAFYREKERVEVAASEITSWSRQFLWVGHEGTWTASAQVEEVSPTGR